MYRNQIKQILAADFDLIFALRLVKDVIECTWVAFRPVLGCAAAIEVMRTAFRLALTWESKTDTFKLLGVLVVWEALYRARVKTWAMQYAVSSVLWSVLDRSTAEDPAMAVSLPVYCYALPIVSCAVLLRVRVFLAQSYVSLLLV